MHNSAHFKLGLAEPSAATVAMSVSSQHAFANPVSADRLSIIRLNIDARAVVSDRNCRGPIVHEQPRRQKLCVGGQIGGDVSNSRATFKTTGNSAVVQDWRDFPVGQVAEVTRLGLTFSGDKPDQPDGMPSKKAFLIRW
jgi:hypothetical protein